VTESVVLDNPVWEALNGRQAEFAIKGDGVLKYRPDVFIFAGIPDDSSDTIEKVAELYKQGEIMGLMGFKLDIEPYFKRVFDVQAYQMLADKAPEYKSVDYVKLTKEDSSQIEELVELTKPGPYRPNVIELGNYVGIKEDDKLVAMVGERVKLDGYTEVSLVCTHPDYRGKGYAKTLSGVVIEDIIDRGDMPFLNVMTHNTAAFNLYNKLGFTTRVEYTISAYMRL
jgi:ribosomal protein S18 acetylase RimI-like enzyme